MKFIKNFNNWNKKIKIERLSGIALIVEDNILLVKANKYKNEEYMWSIPKGHIDIKSSLSSALKEMYEETSIKLDKNFDKSFVISYKKNNKIKILEVFVYIKEKEEIDKYISNKLNIKKKIIKKVEDEIYDIKFFKLKDALIKIEKGQESIIKNIYNKN